MSPGRRGAAGSRRLGDSGGGGPGDARELPTSPTWLRREGDTLVLAVRVQPRATADEVVGPHGDRLKIRVTAPPVEGAANERLVRLLADELGVARSRVRVLAGSTRRDKRIEVAGPPGRRPGWLPASS